MKEFIFTWSIENISYSWYRNREKIISPLFLANPIQSSAWTLRLYPKGFENSDYLSLFLRRESDSAPENLTVNFELSCISADRSLVQTHVVPETLKIFTKAEEYGFGLFRFLKRHEVFGHRKALYLPGDTLTLRCRMWKDEDGDEFGQRIGRTTLAVERTSLTEHINPETAVHHIVDIVSKIQNKMLITINIIFYKDKMDISAFQVNPKLMKCATLDICLVDKRTQQKLCQHQIIWLDGPLKETIRLPYSSTLQNTDGVDPNVKNFVFQTEVVYSTGQESNTLESEYFPKNPNFFMNYVLGCVASGKVADFPSVSKDLYNLYKKQILCDVELKTKDGSLFDHKAVLCARSQVFLAMLTNDMKEKENGCVEIEDITAHTMEKFLIFLYTDALESFECEAIADLYYVADKYRVELLKLVCSLHLSKMVDADNVSALFMLAHQHSDGNLGQKVIDFIRQNEESVFKSTSWKKLTDDKPLLAVQYSLSKYKENQGPNEMRNRIFKQPKLQQDLRFLYQMQTVSDVVINTASTTIPAHKSVLCACSSTFKDMFLNDSSESSIDSFEIKDLEDDILKRMLFFMYTNSLADIQWDTALKLYLAAVAYQMPNLMFHSSCFLLKSLRVSNACELLLSVHAKGEDMLKSAVEHYICVYDEEIFTSNEWAKVIETNIELAMETMRIKYKK